MTGFGHTGERLSCGGFIDTWGRGPFRITVDGREYVFEDSDMFGPALLRKDGELRANPYPAERHPFWEAHKQWRRQGRRTEDDGETCVWDFGNPTLIRHVGPGEHDYEIVEQGDDLDHFVILSAEKEGNGG